MQVPAYDFSSKVSLRISKHFISTSVVIPTSKTSAPSGSTISVIHTQKKHPQSTWRDKTYVFWVVCLLTGLLKGLKVSTDNLSELSDSQDRVIGKISSWLAVSPFWPIIYWRWCFTFFLVCTSCYSPVFGIACRLNFSLCPLHALFGKSLKSNSSSLMNVFYTCSVYYSKTWSTNPSYW